MSSGIVRALYGHCTGTVRALYGTCTRETFLDFVQPSMCFGAIDHTMPFLVQQGCFLCDPSHALYGTRAVRTNKKHRACETYCVDPCKTSVGPVQSFPLESTTRPLRGPFFF